MFFFSSTDIDECLNSSCGDNSVCINLPGGYVCKCDGDFTGVHCNESKYHFIRMHLQRVASGFRLTIFDIDFLY